jgi:hypothetical protein
VRVGAGLRLYGYGGWDDTLAAQRAEVVELAAGSVPAQVLDEWAAFRPPPVSLLVVDGAPLLREPGFWARHLSEVCAEVPALESVFGVARAEWPVLFEAQRWPVFPVGLASGGVLLVVYRTFSSVALGRDRVTSEQETGIDFWLAPDDGGPGLDLAVVAGTGFGPGLRWAELRGVARAALPDRVAAAQRLLLLVPAMGESGPEFEVVSWLAQAVAVVSGRDRRSAEVLAVAKSVVFGGMGFGRPHWMRWEDTWIGDGPVCHRNPTGHGDRWGLAKLRRASRALAPADGG